MNVAIYAIITGAFLLFVPRVAWVGVAVMAIGGVLYAMSWKEPAPAYNQYFPDYMPASRIRRAAPGVELTRRDVASDFEKAKRNPYGAGPQNAPRIEDGMFKLPLPMPDEIAGLADVTYNVPTKAKGFTQQKDKGGNPWLPGF